MAFYEHVLIARQDISPQQAEALLSIDRDAWVKEVEEQGAYLDQYGDRLPAELRAQQRRLMEALRTVETLLSLVQTRSSLRVEWYIVLLIVAELLLSTYPLLLHQ